jgi:hypothetical protein
LKSVEKRINIECSELSSGMYCRAKIFVNRRFRGTCCLVIPDDGGSTYLWNVGRQLFYTAVHPRRQFWTSYSQPWELEISHNIEWFICVRFTICFLVSYLLDFTVYHSESYVRMYGRYICMCVFPQACISFTLVNSVPMCWILLYGDRTLKKMQLVWYFHEWRHIHGNHANQYKLFALMTVIYVLLKVVFQHFA